MNLEKNKKILLILILTLLLFSFILINNLFNYPIENSYDGDAHIEYIKFFSMYLPNDIVLPQELNTYQFYNPPLSYFVPSMSMVLCRNIIDSDNLVQSCLPYMFLTTKIFNILLFLSTIMVHLMIIKKISKNNKNTIVFYFIAQSLLSVNYRAVSMFRSEIYLSFFLSLLIYVIASKDLTKYRFQDVVKISILFSLMIFTRQLSLIIIFAFFVSFFYYSIKKNSLKIFFKTSFQILLSVLIICFKYISLTIKNYGNYFAFNIDTSQKSIEILDIISRFYIFDFDLFLKPVRNYLENKIFLIFFSDLYGDYWGYFANLFEFVNVELFTKYLGFINILALAPFVFFLISLNIKYVNYTFILFFIKFLILLSIVYLIIFNFQYDDSSGDTIKTIYILFAVQLLPVIASLKFNKLKAVTQNLFIYYGFFMFLISFFSFLIIV